MNRLLEELADVLEEEIAVGEELRRNLQAQQRALAEWDVAALLERIAEREPWLNKLSALEQSRAARMATLQSAGSPTLATLIATLRPGAPETLRLRELGNRCRAVFSRLKSDEHYLRDVMEILCSHLEEALRPVHEPPFALYRETGSAERAAGAPALIRSKA
ncbi:MAG TPA: flagellar export chaperone FlgN [candidate division Zixibacteria bacterium]|nr:flagellar export chaperone FlgN [candidate division Zixibacteria bacterium]